MAVSHYGAHATAVARDANPIEIALHLITKLRINCIEPLHDGWVFLCCARGASWLLSRLGSELEIASDDDPSVICRLFGIPVVARWHCPASHLALLPPARMAAIDAEWESAELPPSQAMAS